MVALTVIEIIDILLQAATAVIIVQAILSWLVAFNVISMSNDLFRNIWQTLERLTEPMYRPIRKIMPDFGALDLTPMVVLLLIIMIRRAVLPALAQALLGAM